MCVVSIYIYTYMHTFYQAKIPLSKGCISCLRDGFGSPAPEADTPDRRSKTFIFIKKFYYYYYYYDYYYYYYYYHHHDYDDDYYYYYCCCCCYYYYYYYYYYQWNKKSRKCLYDIF